MKIQVREQRLPGIGVRYDLDLADDRAIFVITDARGMRQVGISGRDDAPDWQITLDPDRAVILTSLLLGARFTLDTCSEERLPGDRAVVATRADEIDELIAHLRGRGLAPQIEP